MTYIYILQLTNNKYYIGKTSSPQTRILNHFQQQGSAWTKKYKPIRIEKEISNADDFDEDKWTIIYMNIYGIDNVRGGSFCSIQLSESNKQTLEQMITGSSDCCYKCGQIGHFIQDCHEQDGQDEYTDEEDEEDEEYEDYEVWCCNYCNKEFDTLKGCTFHENVHCKKKHTHTQSNTNSVICYTCGKPGHYSSDCYSNIRKSKPKQTIKLNINIKNKTISTRGRITITNNQYPCSQCKRLFDTKKGADYHKRFYCKKKTTSSYNKTKKNKSNSNTFYYNY